MKDRSHRAKALLLCALLIPVGILSDHAFAAPAPMDSSEIYRAGRWNTTFSDDLGVDLRATFYYPALSEGTGATADTSGAPYPTVGFVPQQNVSPAFFFYGSYGRHLARRGFVVLMVEMDPLTGLHDAPSRMANATLDGLDLAIAEDGRAGSPLEGMVRGTGMALAGHGTGAKAALLAARKDATRVTSVALLGLLDTGFGYPVASSHGGAVTEDLHIQGGSNDHVAMAGDWFNAFYEKAEGYASVHIIEGANNVQFQDAPHFRDLSSQDGEPEISRSDQHNLSLKYLTAFLDVHLKNDTLAMGKLYGAEARVDLETNVLADWHYGVLDQAVAATRPVADGEVPSGFVPICATVRNVGPFPMPPRNVTLEVARVITDGVLVSVFGPTNKTVPAMAEGGSASLEWRPLLEQYGNYRLFLRMGDPDHNRTNNRVTANFTVIPAALPEIDHDPPGSLELGEEYNLSCRIRVPGEVAGAWVNYTDESELNIALELRLDPVTDTWWVIPPVPIYVGQVSYSIEVEATSGAENRTQRYYVPVVDLRPPVISHEPSWTYLSVMTEVIFEAHVTDLGGVAEVRLRYNEPSTGDHDVKCGRDGNRWYYPVLMGALEGVVEYSWFANDTWGNVASLGPMTVPLADAGPPTIEVLPSGPLELGGSLTLLAEVVDETPVESIWVIYTMPGTTGPTNGTPVYTPVAWRMALPSPTSIGTVTFTWFAIDSNGKLGTSGEREVSVVDTSSPTIVDVLAGNMTVGAEPFVEARVEDLGGLSRVWVELTGVDGVLDEVEMAQQGMGLWRATLPVQSRGGELRYRVMARDGVGNVGASSNRTEVVRDQSPPVLRHTPPTELVEGQEALLAVNVTDDVGVVWVKLYLRLRPGSSYREVVLEQNASGDWVYTIPAGELESPEIRYYFEAEDMPPSSNVATMPPGAPALVLSATVKAAQLSISGVVLGRGGRPLSDATVIVAGQEVSSTSGTDGAYLLAGLNPGTYTIEVSAKGYKTLEFDVVLTALGGDRVQDVTLVPVLRDEGGEGSSMYLVVGILLLVATLVVFLLVLRRGRR